MKKQSELRYTVEQLDHLAMCKYAEAALAPEGPERDALLAAAQNLADRAKVHEWVTEQLRKFPSRAYH